MRSIKSIIKGAVHRIKESCLAFGRKATIAFCTFTFAVSEVMAGSKGAAGSMSILRCKTAIRTSRRPSC